MSSPFCAQFLFHLRPQGRQRQRCGPHERLVRAGRTLRDEHEGRIRGIQVAVTGRAIVARLVIAMLGIDVEVVRSVLRIQRPQAARPGVHHAGIAAARRSAGRRQRIPEEHQRHPSQRCRPIHAVLQRLFIVDGLAQLRELSQVESRVAAITVVVHIANVARRCLLGIPFLQQVACRPRHGGDGLVGQGFDGRRIAGLDVKAGCLVRDLVRRGRGGPRHEKRGKQEAGHRVHH